MSKFIYVFDISSKDRLIKHKFKLLKDDNKNNIYVFENKPQELFSFENINYILSNTLTF